MLERTLRCFRFNGVLFLGSILVYHFGVLTLLDWLQLRMWDAIATVMPVDVAPAYTLAEVKAVLDPTVTAVYYVGARRARVVRVHPKFTPSARHG